MKFFSQLRPSLLVTNVFLFITVVIEEEVCQTNKKKAYNASI